MEKRSAVLLSLFLVFYFFSNGQNFEWSNFSSYGHSNRACSLTESLGRIVTTELSCHTMNYDSSTVLLKCYGSGGSVAWERQFHGYFMAGSSVASDAEGNVYLSISSQKILYFNDSLIFSKGQGEAGSAIAKFSSSGSLIWMDQINFGIFFPRYFDGPELIFSGSIQGDGKPIEYRGQVLYPGGTTHTYFLAKMDPNGDITHFSIADGDRDVYSGQTGAFYASGYSQGKTIGKGANKVYLDPANGPSYLARYNKDLELDFVTQFSSAGYLGVYDDKGELLVCGSFRELTWNGKFIFSSQNYQTVLLSLDSLGGIIWWRLVNGTKFNDAHFISKFNSNYIVSGYTRGIIENNVPSPTFSSTALFTAVFDSTRNLKSVLYSSGTGETYSIGGIIVKDNLILTGKNSFGSPCFGNTCGAADQVFVTSIKLPEAVSVKENDSHSELKIFPNPAAGMFNIALPEIGKLEVIVSKSYGQRVKEITVNSTKQNEPLDLREYLSGLYIVTINGKKSYRGKVVIQ